ncbi:plasmid recombination protein [Agrobacterium tumefaciens]|uniref:plasmid recombination protein n=1 Tax=Agrobacterium tumefaciens TaxID=358 RepID=UPI001FA9BD59|nr:plasmid recombination protein [Agrobacterium tumefaciens]UNZ52848.1 plasmid recombination protein [Agrobacterium tumefaciens]
MGYQFVRLELFSRKGKAGRGTDFVFDEVSRRPQASLHVREPKTPDIVFGMEIHDLRALHDEQASLARVTVKDKSKAVRKDQNTLGTVIISHPATMEEFQSNPSIQRDVVDWERRSVQWLKSLYGDELVTVVRHLDESHPHLHAYLVPKDSEMRAVRFHPGFLAKNEVKAAGPAHGEDDKTLGKRADRAYVEAMRDLLNDFHEKVATPSGLTRLGPQKRRLTRAEWQREQLQAQSLKKTIEKAVTIKTSVEGFIARTKAEAAKITADAAQQQESAQKAIVAARQEQEKAIATMENAIRYGGWAGRLRAVWDNLRKSKIAERIRTELNGEIDRWRQRATDAESRQLQAERLRHQAEKQAREAKDEVFKSGIERDRLRSIVSSVADQFPPELTPTPKLVLKPNSGNRED